MLVRHSVPEADIMKQKRISLIVAVVLAVATGLFTLNYLSSVRRTAALEVQAQREIVIADRDIPARVVITADMLRHAQRRASEIEPGAILDAAKAVGAYSLISIPAGSTITSSKVGRPQNVALSVVLKPGMRAISIAADKVKDVSGLIQPGDRVDVIAIPARVGSETPLARTILRGALVLALGAQLENSAPVAAADAQNVATVTLGVSAAQADLLAMADINATLRLALRSPIESQRSQPVERLVLPAPQRKIPPPPLPGLLTSQLPPALAALPRLPIGLVAPPKAAAGRKPARSGVVVIDGATAPN
jgi:pilus assembly protein CpaB